MTDWRDYQTGTALTRAAQRARKTVPAYLDALNDDLFAGQQASADRQDAANAHVTTHADETLLVERLTTYLRGVLRRDGAMTCDDAGRYLDDVGIAKTGDEANRVRRRIVSVAINRGRKRYWKPDGFTTGNAGRMVTRWVAK